jgi:hypothetical protein
MQAALHMASYYVCYDVRLSSGSANLVTVSCMIVIEKAEARMSHITVCTSAD